MSNADNPAEALDEVSETIIGCLLRYCDDYQACTLTSAGLLHLVS